MPCFFCVLVSLRRLRRFQRVLVHLVFSSLYIIHRQCLIHNLPRGKHYNLNSRSAGTTFSHKTFLRWGGGKRVERVTLLTSDNIPPYKRSQGSFISILRVIPRVFIGGIIHWIWQDGGIAIAWAFGLFIYLFAYKKFACCEVRIENKAVRACRT